MHKRQGVGDREGGSLAVLVAVKALSTYSSWQHLMPTANFLVVAKAVALDEVAGSNSFTDECNGCTGDGL
jgi:hypothetical protein